MMRIGIYKDELWPYFGLTDDFSGIVTVVDLPEKELNEMRRKICDFFIVRERLRDLYEKKEKAAE